MLILKTNTNFTSFTSFTFTFDIFLNYLTQFKLPDTTKRAAPNQPYINVINFILLFFNLLTTYLIGRVDN